MEPTHNSNHIKITDIIFGNVKESYKERYRQEQIKTNVSRMYGLSIYMLIIQILLNIVNVLKPEETKDSNIALFIGLSLVAMTTGLVFLILSILCRRGKIRNERTRQLLPFILMYLYGVIQMTFFALNVQAGTGGMNSYVIAVILISFCIIVKPILNIINVGCCMFFLIAIVFARRNEMDMWSSVMITDTWANLIIITVLVLFMSTVSYSMYVSNFINCMKLEESAEKSKELARIDSLTGAMNRRGFFELLDQRWNEFKAENHTVSVIMFDIDYFKAYNDRYGHIAGDDCLLAVSSILEKYFCERKGYFCRYGGEEFLAVIFPKENEDVFQVVEDARTAVEQINISTIPGGCSGITMSAGFVTARVADEDYEKLIHQADMALYRSKSNGRNIASEYKKTDELS